MEKRSRTEAMEEAMGYADTAVRKAPGKPKPLPERTPKRGLEPKGFSPAEMRKLHKQADGGTPRTDMEPDSPQKKLERLQRGGLY